MGEKVTFDYTNRVIQVDEAPTLVDSDWVVSLDVKIDIYSDGKEDWLTDPNLSKFEFPVSSVGGNPLPGSKKLGSTFFLNSDWKIRPYEGSHIFRVNGNLYSVDGTSPFTPTIGSYNIFLEQQVSSLVDSTVAQLTEIEYSSFEGGVTVDSTSPYSGYESSAGPHGTKRLPVNNMPDALMIAIERGLPAFYLNDEHITIDSGLDYSEYVFVGASKSRTHVTVDSDANVENCEFFDCHLLGTLDGNAKLKDCVLSDLDYIHGYVELCVLQTGTIILGGDQEAHFLDCWSGVPGTDTPVIDLGGSGQALSLRNYNGGIKLINKTGPEKVSVDLNSGQVKIDLTTVTNGQIVIRGVGKVVNSSNGALLQSGIYGNLELINETTSSSFDIITRKVNTSIALSA